MKLVRKELRLNALKLTNTRTSKDNDDLLIIEGYGCHFDTVNGNREVVTEESFKEFFDELKKGRQMPYFNYQHDPSAIIGGWDSIESDGKGLVCVGHLNKRVALVRDTVLPLVESGDLAGLSTEGYAMGYYDESEDIWHAKKFMLLGISLVSLPADFAAEMVVRNNMRIERERKENENNLLINLL